MRYLLFFPLFLLFNSLAQPYQGKDEVIISKETKGANCAPPTTTTYLSINNVRAMIHTAGNNWQIPGLNNSMYEVPKNSGIMALFTSALWLGGMDINNQLKLAALRYREGQDYWTGPLSEIAAETTSEICEKYDKHFITNQDIIREFNAWYQAGISDAQNGTNTQDLLFPNYEIPGIIKEWPAHGDISLGQDYYLAPFFDRNEDGHYNWEDGDYPWHDIHKAKDCKTDRRVSLYGDVNYWWVMNDKGNIHTETNADPIGMEIRAQAFAFASNDEINNMTFFNYELINRGTQTLYNTYFGFFTDGALGDPFDDYVGCDVNRGLGYYYNGDNFDNDNSGYYGYGNNPPAVGVDFFEGPFQDDDGIDNAFGIGSGEALNGIGFGDGVVDNERYGMRRFLYYSNTTNGANINQTDPIIASDYYNYLRGFWKDGTPFYYGGSGHISDPEADPNTIAEFMFPGDTDPLGWGTGGIPQDSWTEQSAGNTPNDRRFVESAGPFTLKPGAVNNITVGVVWARANNGDPFASVVTLKRADDKAQALFENCFKVLDSPHAPEMEVQELSNELILTLYNPLNSNNYNEGYIEFDPFIVSSDSSADKNYRFQGYQIFQLAGPEVSTSELHDPSKARLAAQCDINDGISKLVNFDYVETVDAGVPEVMVEGEDNGIRHSFRITEDLFSLGERKLVNFKRYYFMAVSYAYNNFKDYNPDDELLIDGQKKPYLQSRKAAMGEIKVLEAIPHNPIPEADGTYQLIEYGSGPEITRLDGYGNGNRYLELTDESHNYILTEGLLKKPTYKKGQGPMNVKVIDPLNVKGGYYTCKFLDYTASFANSNAADTASWIIYQYDYENGDLLDSVVSSLTIDGDNEQLIPEWGVSVQIHQYKYYKPAGATGGIEAKTTDLIDASLTFADSSRRWLSFINDNDAFYPTNWIRSGTYTIDTAMCGGQEWLNPCNYADEIYDKPKDWVDVLNGGVAPHRITGYQADFMPVAYYNTTPNTVRKASGISFVPSIDLVLTSDQTKWTRCPVIELGRNKDVTIGNAEAGQLRRTPSVDKNGNPMNDGTLGFGWFPGYAIDLESGARLQVAFGENSFLTAENGADLIWNPTENLVDALGNPVFGGVQPIYVFSYMQSTINNYPAPIGSEYTAYIPGTSDNPSINDACQLMLKIDNGTASITEKVKFYGGISWVAYPLLTKGESLLSTDATIRLRVNKEYKSFAITGNNQGRPMYGWNMDNIATKTGSRDALSETLNMINIVPNPYYAYSEYERNKLDNRVKIINLPEKCTIRIYSTNGKLIKSFKKDSEQTYQDWLLTNEKNIPVASGVYLVHVEVPEIGSVVLKSFIGMRQVDLQNI